MCYPLSVEKKINYQKILEKTLDELSQKNLTPSLLLHACCAPCSSHTLECLASHFKITIFYYNPNIYPPSEYNRRLDELKAFLPSFPLASQYNIKLQEAPYIPEEFYTATNARIEKELQTEAERGERCRRCYTLRMKKAYQYAKENDFEYFTTTLSISPHKDSAMINAIGQHLEGTEGPKFLFSDFKKNNGYLRSLELSKEYNLYRQDYCGCVYSKQNTENERKQKEWNNL